jgi:lysophospholipase L1-like esterase
VLGKQKRELLGIYRMIDNPVITMLLAPILIPQGLYTRLVTLKLPEADGLRQGLSGTGKPLKILILGDSAAAGVGVDSQEQALSGQLVAKLAAYCSLEWRLEAETGSKTIDIIERLEQLDKFKIDVVIVSLGVNDVTANVKLETWLGLQQQLRSILVNKFDAKVILLSSVPPMGQFPSLPQPLRWYLGRKSKAFNSGLMQYSNQYSDLQYLDINFPMEEGYIAKDGFHPSVLAYELWAEMVAKEIKKYV